MTPWNKKQHEASKAKIESRFELLSPYIGQHTKVKVRNPRCGHIFESRPTNLNNRGVECPVCNKEIKAQRCKDLNDQKHEAFQDSLGPGYEKFLKKVRALTRKTYRDFKEEINPEDLLIGRCGVEGAHHVDHILSVKHCYLNNILAEDCAALENLQVIPWEENLNRRDMSLQGK